MLLCSSGLDPFTAAAISSVMFTARLHTCVGNGVGDRWQPACPSRRGMQILWVNAQTSAEVLATLGQSMLFVTALPHCMNFGILSLEHHIFERGNRVACWLLLLQAR